MWNEKNKWLNGKTSLVHLYLIFEESFALHNIYMWPESLSFPNADEKGVLQSLSVFLQTGAWFKELLRFSIF